MNIENNLQICFMGGKQAAIIGTLTVLATGNKMLAAVSYSEDLTYILGLLGVPVYNSIKDEIFLAKLSESDLLLSVHGREIVEPPSIALPKFGAINIHPYLYKYKGADPVGRALKDKEFKASVGAHIIEERVDEGKVLVEEFVDIEPAQSREEIYNRLYPYYSGVVMKVLDMVSEWCKKYGK